MFLCVVSQTGDESKTEAAAIKELVTLHKFSVPANQRFFEDYEAGRVYEFGTTSVSEQDIIDFARRFDPQDFHIDPVKAASGPFGGIIASGWHTISLAMRLYVDHYLSHVASLGSPEARPSRQARSRHRSGARRGDKSNKRRGSKHDCGEPSGPPPTIFSKRWLKLPTA